ncbi:hypothetical protein OH77DRAFT_95556 [Trametes cingulata]|nr:hypothetical protein OH77DRAFT_95556 [Trametes cingulata]
MIWFVRATYLTVMLTLLFQPCGDQDHNIPASSQPRRMMADASPSYSQTAEPEPEGLSSCIQVVPSTTVISSLAILHVL